MDRDYYYFREIFLGLREEYLKIKMELENLKKYIVCNKREIVHHYFSLYHNSQNVLLSIIETTSNFWGNKSASYFVIVRNGLVKSNFFLNEELELDLDCYRIEQLNMAIDEIMKSDFVKKVNLEFENFEKNLKLYLSLSKIILETQKYQFTYYSPNERFYYSLNDEFIEIENYLKNEKITRDYILEILNTKIPKYYLSEYHQYVIEKNKNLKEFQFLDWKFGKEHTNIKIREKKRILLCKKKCEI